MKTVKTPNGTVLPLTNLKGKEYLMVAYRLQWFNEVETNFTIHTDFLKLENDYAICRAVVSVYDKEGKPIKSASATKREDAKHFADFAEKAETSAVGRAISMLGYGTQYAISDLDEGDRIVDSPLVDVKESRKEVKVEESVAKKSSFRKESKKEEPVKVEEKKEESNDGWE